MSYKAVLLGCHGSTHEAREEPAPLSYLDCRNQDALRAWRERYARLPGERVPARPRTWLSALRWADAGLLIRGRP